MAGHRYAAWWGTALNVVVVVIGIYVAHIESFRRVIEVIAVVFLTALLICALVTLIVQRFRSR